MRDSFSADESPHVAVDERADLERQMQMHIDLLRAMVAHEQHVANAKGALIGVALTALTTAIAEGWINSPDATVSALNDTLAQQAVPWRLIRPN